MFDQLQCWPTPQQFEGRNRRASTDMKRIVVGLDLGADTEKPLGRAMQLATDHGAELILAHVVSKARSASPDRDLARAERDLRSRAAPSGVNASCWVRQGNPAHEMAALARSAEADLIVSGPHRNRPFMDLLRQPFSNSVVRRSSVPVLVTNSKPQGPYQRILVTTDFSASAKRVLRAALMLSPSAEFHLLHVYREPFSGRIHFRDDELEDLHESKLLELRAGLYQEMRLYSDFAGHRELPRIMPVLERNEVGSGIGRVITRLGPDLLAMGLSKLNFFGLVEDRARSYQTLPACDVLMCA